MLLKSGSMNRAVSAYEVPWKNAPNKKLTLEASVGTTPHFGSLSFTNDAMVVITSTNEKLAPTSGSLSR